MMNKGKGVEMENISPEKTEGIKKRSKLNKGGNEKMNS